MHYDNQFVLSSAFKRVRTDIHLELQGPETGGGRGYDVSLLRTFQL
jgi:hypothetical protein